MYKLFKEFTEFCVRILWSYLKESLQFVLRGGQVSNWLKIEEVGVPTTGMYFMYCIASRS
jgi:hypothetical protein